MNCRICNQPLKKYLKSTCSIKCRTIYVNGLNKGRPSQFKGVTNRWTDEQRKQMGESSKGIKRAEEFKEKCRQRMIGGISLFKGHHHTKEAKDKISRSGKQSYHWKGDDKPHRRKGGLTISEFKMQIIKQKNLCAICGSSLTSGTYAHTTACADHDHLSGFNRGILCKRCNLMIGLAHDDILILAKAVKYLKLWKRKA